MDNDRCLCFIDLCCSLCHGDLLCLYQDRHAVAQQLPLIDDQQDYELLGGHEEDGQTVITFRRRLDTCDDNDYAINVISNLESVFHLRVDRAFSKDSSA